MSKTTSKRFDPIPSEIEIVAKQTLDAAFQVHTALGPGLLESVYEQCLAYELRERGIDAKTQVTLPISYKDIRMESGYRLDLFVEDCVVVEIKAVEKMSTLFEAQLLTYLKLAEVRVGFLINFNVPHLKDDIKRMVY